MKKKFYKSWLFRLPSSLQHPFQLTRNSSKRVYVRIEAKISASKISSLKIFWLFAKLKNDRLEIPQHPWGLSVLLLITQFLSFIAIVRSRKLFHRRVAHLFCLFFFIFFFIFARAGTVLRFYSWYRTPFEDFRFPPPPHHSQFFPLVKIFY